MRNTLIFMLVSSCILQAEEDLSHKYEMVENKASLSLLNPELSQRKYSKLRLENGIEAYLISDPGTDKSAAALAVNAGSWDDPKEYPGMAHFLEHMLFMGTEAYPSEMDYMHYINDHGGNVNAYTAPDRTVYMFSINNDFLEQALDRFSHFFIDPILSTSSINRELHAVDQEHSKNIEHDGWRQYMVFKETSNPYHPNAMFTTGNAATLSGIPQEALRKWYETHYSPEKMHLVVLSPLSLSELTKLVVLDFSTVPLRENHSTPISEKMTSPKQLGHITYIKPIKQLRKLDLNWEIPQEFCTLDGLKYAELIAYTLGNKGEGSLFSLLKKEKIAEDIHVSIDALSQNAQILSLSIDLTQFGVTQIDRTIFTCFQMLSRLKEEGIPSYLFHEKKRLSQIQYQYQSRKEIFSFVSDMAHKMVDEKLETFPENTEIATSYIPGHASELLNYMTPQNCFFSVMADPKLSGVLPNQREKWMDAEYAMEEVPESTIRAWQEAKPIPSLHVPSPNVFVPTALTLLSENSEKKLTPPQAIVDESGEKIYYAPDSYYKVPEVGFEFRLQSPLLDGSAVSLVKTDLFVQSIDEKLSAILEDAGRAGLNASFGSKDFGLEIYVTGFSDKASVLTQTIFKNLANVLPSREDFEIYKHRIANIYENTEKELPVQQAAEILSSILSSSSPTHVEKLHALENVTYENFIEFSQRLTKVAFVQGLLYGNISQEKATQLWHDLRSSLNYTAYPKEEHRKKKILSLSDKQGPFMIHQQTERQGNGIILVIQQGPFSFEKRGEQQILAKAMQESFFDTLRTKQQVAYIAKSWDNEMEKQLFQTFAVQSSSHTPTELLARFELFLEDFDRNFETNIPKSRFETIRSNLVRTLKIPPENLSAMTHRFFSLGFDYEGDFAFLDKRIDALQLLSYEQISDFAKQMLSRKNSKRIAVMVEGVQPDSNYRYEKISKEEICEIGSYSSIK